MSDNIRRCSTPCSIIAVRAGDRFDDLVDRFVGMVHTTFSDAWERTVTLFSRPWLRCYFYSSAASQNHSDNANI